MYFLQCRQHSYTNYPQKKAFHCYITLCEYGNKNVDIDCWFIGNITVGNPTYRYIKYSSLPCLQPLYLSEPK